VASAARGDCDGALSELEEPSEPWVADAEAEASEASRDCPALSGWAAAGFAVFPGNALAAIAVNIPVKATLPAMSQRFMRVSFLRPASLDCDEYGTIKQSWFRPRQNTR